MAEENEGKNGEEAAEAAAAPVQSKKKMMILAGVGVVVLLIAIGVPVAMMLTKKDTKSEDLAADAAREAGLVPEGSEDEDELDEGEAALGAIFPLDTFVVNLQGGRFIRTQLQLEFEAREIPKRFYAKMVLIRDAIIGLLAKRTAEDVLSDKGRSSLKSEVRESVNEILKKEDIKAVYFTQFVVQ
jgi:flagellar basal body-associated protein FliL